MVEQTRVRQGTGRLLLPHGPFGDAPPSLGGRTIGPLPSRGQIPDEGTGRQGDAHGDASARTPLFVPASILGYYHGPGSNAHTIPFRLSCSAAQW